jgi:hypothetical protein
VVIPAEFVIAVEGHRRQMEPFVAGLADAVDDDTARDLVGLLEETDRTLGHLCHRLSQHLGQLELRR